MVGGTCRSQMGHWIIGRIDFLNPIRFDHFGCQFFLHYTLQRLENNPTYISVKDMVGNTFLHYIDDDDSRAAYLRLAKFCLDSYGADPKAKNDKGDTALHLAIYWRHRDVVRFLIQNGTDIDATDGKGNTALCLACIHGQYDTI
jgi:ankyrin repeat protein